MSDWIYHKRKDVDLAILPYPKFADANIQTTRAKRLINYSDLSVMDEVFFLSFNPNIELKNVDPIARNGIISYLNSNQTFIIDGTTFPGNSGSPVFTKPNPYHFEGEKIKLEVNPLGLSFIGIISAYIPYREPAIGIQSGRTRVVFEENTGLTIVHSSALIYEMEKYSECKTQCERVIQRVKEITRQSD